MSESLSHVAEACRLIHLALGRATTPLNNEEYGALFEKYRTDAGFKLVVNSAADGQGLQIYAAHHEYGLLLVNHQEEFFCPKLSDFNDRISTAQERLAFGVLFYLLAAYVYRTPEAIADDFGREMPLRVSQVVSFARQQLQLAKASAAGANGGGGKIESACDFLLSVPEGGREAPKRSLRGMIQHVLDYYADHGLFTKEEGLRQAADDTEEDNARSVAYRPRAAYRVQVRMMTNEGATALLQTLRSETK
jgi:hypothetical protein